MIDAEFLIKEAIKAKEYSYAPYSQFHVGAALLCADGSVYTGCNIENAAYTPTNCAERTAVFKAVSEGKREFTAIAVIGDSDEYLAPCGVCRQVLAEFVCPKDFDVIMAKNESDYKLAKLTEVFPYSFGKKDLQNK